MFAKIVVLILSMGVLAAGVLANRQQRIQAAHDLAESQRKLVEHDRALWELRLKIAARITPERVETAARRLGDMQTIRSERFTQLLAWREQLAGGLGVDQGELSSVDTENSVHVGE